MSGRLSRARYPWWVRVSLWGLHRRSAVLGFAWLSVAAAGGGVRVRRLGRQPALVRRNGLLVSGLFVLARGPVGGPQRLVGAGRC